MANGSAPAGTELRISNASNLRASMAWPFPQAGTKAYELRKSEREGAEFLLSTEAEPGTIVTTIGHRE